jgi:hypothetical protein
MPFLRKVVSNTNPLFYTGFMKKLKGVVFFVLILAVTLNAIADEKRDNDKERTGAVVLMVVPLVRSIFLDEGINVIVGQQTAILPDLAISALAQIGVWDDMFLTTLRVGPQFRPGRGYLAGFYVGAYPGVWYAETEYWFANFTGTLFLLTLDAGYQFIFSSMVFGASLSMTDYFLTNFSFSFWGQLSINVQFGFAY